MPPGRSIRGDSDEKKNPADTRIGATAMLERASVRSPSGRSVWPT
jgi:hypothetical protein